MRSRALFNYPACRADKIGADRIATLSGIREYRMAGSTEHDDWCRSVCRHNLHDINSRIIGGVRSVQATVQTDTAFRTVRMHLRLASILQSLTHTFHDVVRNLVQIPLIGIGPPAERKPVA